MPRTCSICSHHKRTEIDKALLGGESFRNIAERFGTSATALTRHKADHLTVRMLKAAERREDADIRTAIDVVGQLRAINGASLTILKEARDARDGDLALKAIDRIQKQIELQAKLIGELQQEGAVNIIINPEWVRIRTTLIVALRPYPDASLAVAGALQAIEGGTSRAAD